MGFIQIAVGAAWDSLKSTFGDQFLDFLVPPAGVGDTAVVFPAVTQGTNAGRGQNTRGSENIITNGSVIIVPEGYGLLTFQDGAVTAVVAEPGAFRWDSEDQNSKSVFSGGGLLSSTFTTSWERFKFGGRPGSQQLAFYVNLKQIPNNRFGTQSPIYWDDRYLNAQAGAITRGTYVLKVVDPILFVKNLVPASYISAGARPFDITEHTNPVSEQLFSEVVGSLAGAFSRYVNDADKEHRITRIQGDSVGFAKSLADEVEANYEWESGRGLQIESATLVAIEYDEDTTALLSDVRRADALSGGRSDTFLKQSVARGVQAAGESGGGGTGLAMMGMGMGAIGNLVPPTPTPGAAPAAATAGAPAPAPAQAPADPAVQLAQYKKMLDDGLINEDDFEALKKKVLGL
ncbi:SPFH domain-containing protein [Demequina lignilytica]|uniref:SPFH domain-containing protein n=1 Tax=Demequina lignilytica TaxID=3051663 RepID=A0AAW7M879_9MICO|nr:MULTISPECIES: SPFH domain-containing protein [unclassified Demequina]MDN4479262.1 SPFH domain-containing protein [Demequina sp. SYSU T00039-1]MDN4483102.1 SPFH domain-containing protein [Demequina sp. SYSU T0a273]MDN4487580.1 SPFH domain-containing protein [Demequina sp. SYSU T00039]MDN4490950.1 SPFH domain-containing protein [Demequina sp. SYSU T00068]